MSQDNIVLGRQLRPVTYKRLCHLEQVGHNKVIQPGKIAYQVTSGKAQGVYHNARCYQNARKHYEQLEKEFIEPLQDL